MYFSLPIDYDKVMKQVPYGKVIPLSFVPVIFYRKCDGFIIRTDDTMIADSNPVGV